MSEGTFGWRIYDLKQKNVIKSIGKGIYTLSDKKEYSPLLNKLSKKIAKSLTESYSDLDYCICETAWLNEFSTHQTTANFIVLEIERTSRIRLLFS